MIFSRLCSKASELHILLVEANQRLLWTCNVIILNKVQDTLALLFTISQTFWTFHCILLAELLVKMLSLTCISLLAEFPPPPSEICCALHRHLFGILNYFGTCTVLHLPTPFFSPVFIYSLMYFVLFVWGCCSLCFRHKPTKFAYCFLFIFLSVLVFVFIYMALSTVFHSINSPDNSLLSHSVLPALLVLSTIHLFMKVPFSPDIILCGQLGLKHQLTNLLNCSVAYNEQISYLFCLHDPIPRHLTQSLCSLFSPVEWNRPTSCYTSNFCDIAEEVTVKTV